MVAEGVVGGAGLGAARVADPRPEHALGRPELGLGKPESANRVKFEYGVSGEKREFEGM